MSFKFDVEAVRKQFPACSIEIDGTPIAYLDEEHKSLSRCWMP